ncbi:hypothetical protein N7501_006661 [Penicillium viridicatum]|nr:hypothetical protein N7501_006661 [Penicillium viridicatum]
MKKKESGRKEGEEKSFRDSLGVTKGGFRVQVHVLWRDGTPHSSEFYFPDSVVTEDEGRVKGKWEVQTTDESREASFEIAPDLSTANLSFKDPKAVVRSIKLTRINDATILPNTEDEIEFGVGVNYIRPMAITTATAILDIFIPSQQPLVPVQRRQFSLGETDEAIGGMDRFWTQFSWPQIMIESYHLRAGAGPYRLHVLRIISTAAMGEKIYGSARLYRDNRTVCSAQQATDDDSMTGGGDYFVVTKLYEQGKCSVQGGFRDPNIGYRIEFVYQRFGGQRRRWRFDAINTRPWWNLPTSAPGPNATGNSGFMVKLRGGMIDNDAQSASEMFEGYGGSGQAELP